jgi:hypothetical protein
MLEKFVESKIKIERARIDKYDDISKSDIRKSKLPPPIKRYILSRSDGKLSGDEFDSLLTKAIKLNINYSIRPGWTILNFLFSKYDSQQCEVIKEKSDVFTFYRFYIDFIVNYIDEHSLVVITKDKVERFINEANRALHEKLVNNISGVKVKNFFIQLYRLAEKDQVDVSLTSTVPFLFIKTFLEDKDYEDILLKFNSIEDLSNETEISLKDCIKIVSDKFAPPAPEVTLKESIDIVPDYKDEERVDDDKIVKDISETDNVKIDEKKEDEIAITLSNENKSNDDKDVVDEKKHDNNIELDSVVEGDNVIDVEFGDHTDEQDVDVKKDDFGDEKIDSGDLANSGKSKLPTEVIGESNLEIEKKSISRLFKHGELVNICQLVYNGDKHRMHESFRTLKDFEGWKEASEYIKDYFYDNNIDIYNKNVLLFVDVLNDYFNQLDGN